MTPAAIEAACDRLRAQLQGTHVAKDKIDISVPTKMTLTDDQKPTIMVSVVADRKMRALVQQCDKEIGWHGTVRYEADINTYVIEDIFVFPQEITGTTVQSIDEVYGLWLMELSDEDFNKLRMHGHSHVNMGTSPSGVDTAYQETLIDRVQDFYIFIILNKRDDYYVCLFDVANNYMYEKNDLFYDAEIEEVDAWAKDAITTHVKVKTYAAPTTVFGVSTSTTVVDPNKNVKHPVVLKTWRQGWAWEATVQGFVPSSEHALQEYLRETGTQLDRRKPGRPKKNHGGDTKPGSAYKEYQQQKLKDIDMRRAMLECDGNCIACKLQCPYKFDHSY